MLCRIGESVVARLPDAGDKPVDAGQPYTAVAASIGGGAVSIRWRVTCG